jgi:hypothetical protein
MNRKDRDRPQKEHLIKNKKDILVEFREAIPKISEAGTGLTLTQRTKYIKAHLSCSCT